MVLETPAQRRQICLTWSRAARKIRALERFTLQFLGILAALSMLRDWNYLFTESAVIGGRRVLSDTGAIEAALVLPHWIWAGLITLLSALAIGASLKHALEEDGSTARL